MSQAPKAGNYYSSGEQLEKAAMGRIKTADTQLHKVTARPLTGLLCFLNIDFLLLFKKKHESTSTRAIAFLYHHFHCSGEGASPHRGSVCSQITCKKSMKQLSAGVKHLVARVPAGLLHNAGLKSAGNTLFMDFAMLLTRERMDGRVFLQTPSPPENGKSKSDWKESNQSQEPLPELSQRSSCSTLTPAPAFH